jgi:hypothetical protein
LFLSGYLLWPFDFDFSRENNVRWIKNGNGIEFPQKGLLITKEAPKDLFEKLTTGSGMTIEIWIESDIIYQQGPARIISYSIDPYLRNFTLGQSEDGLILRLRTTHSDLNGLYQQLELNNVFMANKIHHVAATYDFKQRCVFVDGNLALSSDRLRGDFSNWDPSYKLIIGNEASGNRPWLGKIYYAAIYNRALTGQEIFHNYLAGYEGTSASIKSSEIGDYSPVVTYFFDETVGDTVYDRNRDSNHVDLNMPKKLPRGRRGIMMISLTDNFEDISSINNILSNILGFFPLGFLFCAYLKACGHNAVRTTFLVLTVALIISFGFEYLHFYLPKQHSSAVEVFLKVSGTFFGMEAFFILRRAKKC